MFLSPLVRHLHSAKRLCSEIRQAPLLLVSRCYSSACSMAVTNTATNATPQHDNVLDKIKTRELSWTDLSRKVNTQLRQNTVGRLFAVIMAAGKQRKITNEDIIVLDKPIEAQIGEKILLNKVLLVGGSDFTLIGRPILKPNIVKVEATVIEKPLSHPIVMSWYRRRENFRFFKLRKINYTYLRINDIKLFELPA